MLRNYALVLGACALLAGLIGLHSSQVEACNGDPCTVTGPIVVNSGMTTVDYRPTAAQGVVVPVTLTATCGGPTGATFAYISQIDGYADATAMTLSGLPQQPFTLSPATTFPAEAIILLPIGAVPGIRTFQVDLVIGGVTFSTTFDVAVASGMRISDLTGPTFALPGTQVTKQFEVENLTAQPMTIAFSLTSQQTSSTPGTFDHYPISMCSQPLGPGDPYATAQPVVMDTLTVQPFSSDTICFSTRSYPPCHNGSNCQYQLTANNLSTGEQAVARTSYTVVDPTWTGTPTCIRGVACGDGNVDGQVNILDALVLAQCLVGMIPPTPQEECYLDVNADGRLDILDALLVAQHSAGIVQALTCP